jgi:hypothetical protein
VVMKRIELGLATASWRTFDEVTVRPVGLSVLMQELVRRESRDDPSKYQTYITQEEKENAMKPKNPPTANIIQLQDVLEQQGLSQASGQVNVENQQSEKDASGSRRGGRRRQQTRGAANGKEEESNQGRGCEPLELWSA